MIDSKGKVAFSNVKRCEVKSLSRYFEKAKTIFCPFSLKLISDSVSFSLAYTNTKILYFSTNESHFCNKCIHFTLC